MRRNIIFSVILSCLFQTIVAQPGQLDPVFGNHGIVKANLGQPVQDITYFSGDQAIPLPGGQMYWVLEGSGKTFLSKRLSNGSADTTYGEKGFAVLDLTGSYAVLQADGKVLIGGMAPDGHLSIYRCKTDGNLDTSFSGDGKLTTDATLLGIQKDGKIAAVGKGYLINYNSSGTTHSAYLIAPVPFTGFYTDAAFWLRTGTFLQSDGKIILAGVVGNGMALVRINQNGSIDTTFGDKGLVVNVFDSCTSYANTVAIQPDGKIVVGGHAYVGMSVNAFFILARFNVNGSPDTMFGVGGRQKTVFEGHYSVGTHVVIAPDGKIVLEGRADSWMAIARYTKNGIPDSSFNGDGKQLNPQSPDDIHSDIAVQSDLKIVGVGSGAVVRYNENGTLDDSFGQNGVATDKFVVNHGPRTSLNYVGAQKDGKIIGIGTGWNGGGSSFGMLRLNKNGGIDNTVFPMADPQQSYASITMQADEKLLFSGVADNNTFSFARYNSNGSPDSSFGVNGVDHLNLGNGYMFSVPASVQDDGKIVAVGQGSTFDWAYQQYENAFEVLRLNQNGTLDSTFGDYQDGKEVFSLWGAEWEPSQYLSTVATGTDGTIYTGGNAVLSLHYDESCPFCGDGLTYIFSLSSGGGFNGAIGGGALYESIARGGWPAVKTLLVQKDGKIVALLDVGNQFKFHRFNQDGGFDTTFGEGGTVITTFDSSVSPGTFVIGPDDKIIAGGVIKADSTTNDFVIIRYNKDGSPDSTFGINGKQTTNAGGSEALSSMVIANNRLYVAGTSYDSTANIGVIASYFLDNEQPKVLCPPSKIVSTAKNRCDTTVNNIDPVVSIPGTQISYTFTGATTGTGTGSASGKVFNKGVTIVKYSVAADTSNSCLFTVTVNDHQAPDLSPVFAFPNVLWPANNTMRNVYLFYSDRDNCGNTKCNISVTSNQDIGGDWQIVNDHLIKLRAQHSAGKTRLYTVAIKCQDVDGNITSRNISVWVPAFGQRDNYVNSEGNAATPFEKIMDGFGVRAYPNPSNDQFNLQLISNNINDKISLRIYDISGRAIEVKTGLVAGENIQVGLSLRPGTYIAEVQQGTNVQRLWLVKIK